MVAPMQEMLIVSMSELMIALQMLNRNELVEPTDPAMRDLFKRMISRILEMLFQFKEEVASMPDLPVSRALASVVTNAVLLYDQNKNR